MYEVKSLKLVCLGVWVYGSISLKLFFILLLTSEQHKFRYLPSYRDLITGNDLKLQVFNEFNARKPDEMNVFKGVLKNRLFVSIVGLTVVLQVYTLSLAFFLALNIDLFILTITFYCLGYHNILSWKIHFNCETELAVMACFNRHWSNKVSLVLCAAL